MSTRFPYGTILVFAKQPRPGHVKTRLAPRVSADAAAEFALAGLHDTLRIARGVAPVELAWDGDLDALPRLPSPVPVSQQAQGDLGSRMGAAFETHLAQGASWVLALGTDSPGLPRTALEAACRWLDHARAPRAVLGPSNDGGYWLIGVSAWQPHLLTDLPWSVPTTLAATRERLEARGYAYRELAEYFDVDEPQDLERLVELWRSGDLDAPATQAWLERWFSGSNA
ncbi:MAG: TIGR04282 family arsenosugar biosynthesis glycosyltransferase [Myxococcales bacterium]|nr:TIGR04282 family arsenosugar biosynthesis glycosyltransferase [Myxococcales bacterium]